MGMGFQFIMRHFIFNIMILLGKVSFKKNYIYSRKSSLLAERLKVSLPQPWGCGLESCTIPKEKKVYILLASNLIVFLYKILILFLPSFGLISLIVLLLFSFLSNWNKNNSRTLLNNWPHRVQYPKLLSFKYLCSSQYQFLVSYPTEMLEFGVRHIKASVHHSPLLQFVWLLDVLLVFH